MDLNYFDLLFKFYPKEREKKEKKKKKKRKEKEKDCTFFEISAVPRESYKRSVMFSQSLATNPIYQTHFIYNLENGTSRLQLGCILI
jgi:hypothetical protein